jgi:hypothetical protein
MPHITVSDGLSAPFIAIQRLGKFVALIPWSRSPERTQLL